MAQQERRIITDTDILLKLSRVGAQNQPCKISPDMMRLAWVTSGCRSRFVKQLPSVIFWLLCKRSTSNGCSFLFLALCLLWAQRYSCNYVWCRDKAALNRLDSCYLAFLTCACAHRWERNSKKEAEMRLWDTIWSFMNAIECGSLKMYAVYNMKLQRGCEKIILHLLILRIF